VYVDEKRNHPSIVRIKSSKESIKRNAIHSGVSFAKHSSAVSHDDGSNYIQFNVAWCDSVPLPRIPAMSHDDGSNYIQFNVAWCDSWPVPLAKDIFHFAKNLL
jgi:hypothetical protein